MRLLTAPARAIAVVALAFTLAACATAHETPPARSATEQLLVSHSAERAAIKLRLELPAGARTFVDGQAVTGEGSGYLIAAVRAELARRGARLVDRASADVVVELRSAALSIDQVDRVLGLPAMTVPTSKTLQQTTTTPELSLYSTHKREGVAEISALALDAHTGAMIATAGPAFATTTITAHRLLSAYGFGQLELRPKRERPDR